MHPHQAVVAPHPPANTATAMGDDAVAPPAAVPAGQSEPQASSLCWGSTSDNAASNDSAACDVPASTRRRAGEILRDDGSDAHDCPALYLHRRVSDADKSVSYEVSPHTGCDHDRALASLLTVSLGSHLTMSQLRIDAALATVEARWCAWRAARESNPDIKPTDSRLRRVYRDGMEPLSYLTSSL